MLWVEAAGLLTLPLVDHHCDRPLTAGCLMSSAGPPGRAPRSPAPHPASQSQLTAPTSLAVLCIQLSVIGVLRPGLGPVLGPGTPSDRGAEERERG